ncbi:MAG: histidine phosphatase family protein, partial [Anaerolineae bacterium]|nr:histidine phosphatase family protein [Anaerolineae bacterium]
MSILYLVRHPHTRVDLKTPAQAWGLSETGRSELDALLAAPIWPYIAALYPSTEGKARQPAERIAERYGLPVRPLAALGEVDRHAYTAPDQASYAAAVAAFFAQPEASP